MVKSKALRSTEAGDTEAPAEQQTLQATEAIPNGKEVRHRGSGPVCR